MGRSRCHSVRSASSPHLPCVCCLIGGWCCSALNLLLQTRLTSWKKRWGEREQGVAAPCPKCLTTPHQVFLLLVPSGAEGTSELETPRLCNAEDCDVDLGRLVCRGLHCDPLTAGCSCHNVPSDEPPFADEFRAD